MKLLHIDSSALGGYSVSRQLTADIVAELKRSTPDANLHYHDLAAQPLPHWTPVADASDPAAVLGNQLLEEFLAADVVVIGAPMYNFAISSSLKAWLDRILVAGKTFRYTANGPEGLAGGKRVIVASSRGGIYSKDSAAAAMDFQEPYLRAAFAFIGIDDVEFVRAEGMAIGDEQKAAALKSAHGMIETLVAKAA
ncbi:MULTISPECIES: FMN-dependent NADH-azoreductase [Rhodanobacter]|uniref:FMN dependent NADH:quinone oxidoreductase n=1 Tax=Rhodanobacter denitrificans TaxID=666685 RepID=M4ND52_9GAMM|nr:MULTISPECIES: FMN-dependent NADH-azoreductase [Rhodanobacter]AGG88660.1 acyl carrier protein phosphodiesterase [Rhodanobacter denitrificans]KZC20455.1 FMN-dependent NADH-azoreductase [Rhodanobacter denitrificans]UJJ52542.1 FMN-dependent NADH-azoreductase [Rhodanobacter denitrificans]UJJ58672.1 FMN-dependent NADH-azoreductase [Rhodanobacter denitrificans]UJM87795.1 FMN-dependent NADH-azoreductase [Rhodanobacter denitrificans]